MDRVTVEDRAATSRSAAYRPRLADQGARDRPIVRDAAHDIALALIERRIASGTQLCCASDDRFKYGPYVGWRAGNRAENVAGRRLLLQRLGDLRMGRCECR